MANLPAAPKIKVEIIDLSDEEDVKPVIVNGIAQEPPKDNSASSSLNQTNNNQQSSAASTNLNENSTNNNNSLRNDPARPILEDTQNDSNIGPRPRITDEARKQRIAEYRRKRLEYKKSLRASRKRLELRMAAELVRDIENKLMQNLY